jgi:hypothetical protein
VHEDIIDSALRETIDEAQYDESNPLVITEEDSLRRKSQSESDDFAPKRKKLSAKKVKALRKIVQLKSGGLFFFFIATHVLQREEAHESSSA